jgi:hypothetical protein
MRVHWDPASRTSKPILRLVSAAGASMRGPRRRGSDESPTADRVAPGRQRVPPTIAGVGCVPPRQPRESRCAPRNRDDRPPGVGGRSGILRILAGMTLRYHQHGCFASAWDRQERHWSRSLAPRQWRREAESARAIRRASGLPWRGDRYRRGSCGNPRGASDLEAGF